MAGSILIVEDDADIAHLVAIKLGAEGHDCYVASSTEAAAVAAEVKAFAKAESGSAWRIDRRHR